MEQYVERTLKHYGFDCEIHLNEWNNAHSAEGRGTSYACAHGVAMLLAMQDTEAWMLNYYDTRIGASVYGGMFEPVMRKPYCLYYGYKAFNELYRLGTQVSCTVEEEGVYAIAATNGEEQAVLIANIGADTLLTTDLQGYTVYLVDETHPMEAVEWDSASFTLRENQTVLLKK